MEPLAEETASKPDRSAFHRSASDRSASDPSPQQEVPSKVTRGRPGFIVLAAIITEVVVIAVVGNQAVSQKFADYIGGHFAAEPDYKIGALQSGLTFAWRFTPASGQPTKEWGAQWAGIGTLLLLTFLLGWVVSRGSVTFSRIWVSIGALVAILVPIAAMVRNVVALPSRPGPLQSRLGQAVYGWLGFGSTSSPPFGPIIVAGIVLGFLAGLFAAIIALITRRTIALGPLSRPDVRDAPINAYGVPTPGYQPPPWQAEPETAVIGAPVAPSDATTVIAPIQGSAPQPTDASDAPTAYIPAAGSDVSASSEGSPESTESTEGYMPAEGYVPPPAQTGYLSPEGGESAETAEIPAVAGAAEEDSPAPGDTSESGQAGEKTQRSQSAQSGEPAVTAEALEAAGTTTEAARTAEGAGTTDAGATHEAAEHMSGDMPQSGAAQPVEANESVETAGPGAHAEPAGAGESTTDAGEYAADSDLDLEDLPPAPSKAASEPGPMPAETMAPDSQPWPPREEGSAHSE